MTGREAGGRAGVTRGRPEGGKAAAGRRYAVTRTGPAGAARTFAARGRSCLDVLGVLGLCAEWIAPKRDEACGRGANGARYEIRPEPGPAEQAGGSADG